jgi:hypothetical protein
MPRPSGSFFKMHARVGTSLPPIPEDNGYRLFLEGFPCILCLTNCRVNGREGATTRAKNRPKCTVEWALSYRTRWISFPMSAGVGSRIFVRDLSAVCESVASVPGEPNFLGNLLSRNACSDSTTACAQGIVSCSSNIDRASNRTVHSTSGIAGAAC